MSRLVNFVDTTTRDGNQSLWSATGLTTPDVVAIAPTMERVGYEALDFTSSTHMAVSVRFHREDPWERIRLMSAAMPNTPLSFITTGMRFISWVPADEDFMRFAFGLVVRNGIRRFQIAEPSNDPQRLRTLAAMAKQQGVEQVVVGLTYSISDVHTHRYYAEHAAALADSPDMDRLYLKDPGGLLTPDAVRELAPHFIAAAGGRPLELHSHCTIGLAPLVYVEGVRAGFEVLHTASGPLSRGTSQPEVAGTARNLEAAGYSHALDLEAEAVVAEHFAQLARVKGLPAGIPREYDAAYYRHQLPGGMVTTTRRMLEELRRGELFDAVLEEVTRVRAEMGYPILVTPVSQFVASQAARNVIDGERWTNVSDETVRTTHKLLDSTFTSSPQVLPAQMGLPGLAKALHGQKTGSRVLAVLPPKYGYGTQGNSQIGITPTDTTVWVVDLIRAFSPTSAAAGTRVSSGGGSLPTVSNAPAGAPTITIPKAAPPSKLVVKTLIQGTGPKLADGQTIVAQVVGTNWRTKKVFYSTWPTAATPSGAPFSFVLGGQVIPGWNKGLVGIPAGSRVMLIVPPAEGYGKSGDSSAGIKSTDTLVFVVDILDAVSGTAS